jgi:glycosyl transferase family 2
VVGGPLVTAPLLTYLLPLRTDDGDDVSELAGYLQMIAGHAEVLVVDGSSTEEIARHRSKFGPRVRVVATEQHTKMGKVGNVLTGLRHAGHDRVVIADDDVRYTLPQLVEVERRLDRAEVVRPQNYFSPLPWHARVDGARTLLGRVTGGDWPGTLAVRRAAVFDAGGYAGDVMFENLELVRTVRAAGGREHLALDLLIARRPPTTAHFARQQVRQAYDELARPSRLLVSMAVLPATVVALGRGRGHAVVTVALIIAAAAETGRRRAGGRSAYPMSSVVLAPPWMCWRSLCSWAAVVARMRGGVKYRDTRIRRAATPMRELRRVRARQQGSAASSSSGTRRSSASDPPARDTAAPALHR